MECGRDVEWCAKMWWSDLMRIMVRNVVRCGLLQFQTWCDVESDRNAVTVMCNMAWCGMWCPGMWNVA